MRKLLILLLLAALPAIFLAACGEKDEGGDGAERDRLSVALDFYANPDHAGIYVAEDRGYFEQAGLDVRLTEPPPDDLSLPLKQAARGQADLAITYEPEVLLAREQGLDVVAVAALVQRPLTSLIWLRRNRRVRNVADLEGRRVATAGIAYQTAFLDTALRRAGVDPGSVRRVDVGSNLVKPLVSRRVDAVLGAFWNVEGEQLRLRRERAVIRPVDEIGVPRYDELVLVTSRRQLEEDPEPIKLFLAALRRGTRAAAEDPGATAGVLREANPDLEARLTRASLRATLPVLDQRGGRPFGYLDPTAWREFGAWMLDNELLDRRPDTTEAITNDLLPEGPS